ncbi:LuxR C-terminal-related transcriptional regulator [Cupriavidus sp. WKF15]|uniref:helix-turn-helix transcriptional regulator n=1 Tax=Cupriavidus sp. WKF15 TaxID=3032282 RepID=UPI0023E21978|nr:helix-turn-helix transcriptional regulator [Cupriavidus sp. WKF15]WER48886.1 LuxR C-terminal-related transcriptional regulator [Cupriavidus sp. WKF15]
MLMEVSHNQAAAHLFAQTTVSLSEFSALLGDIYQGPMEQVPWGKALEHIRRQLNANYATLILRSPATDRPGLMVNVSEHGGSTLAGETSYNNYYYALDPFIGLPSDRVVTIDEHLGPGVWCQSEIYQQFLKDVGIRYILGADLRTDDGVECRFRLCRNIDSPNFSTADKALCTALLPHLKRAVDLHSRIDVVESERTVYASAIDRMLVGMVILDESGTIIKTNAAADEILGARDGIRISKGGLDVEYGQENRKFQRLLRQAMMGHLGTTPALMEAMSITRPSGNARLGVLIRTIPLSEWSEDNRKRPACVVFIRDPERRSQASHDVVRQLFDFTPAETQLALQLANGLTLDEAADELGISKNTARAHLRAIFSKTGVTRQATLVRMLLSSVISLG